MDRDRDWFERDVLDRFIRYARVHTTSDRHSTSNPSSEIQFDLARMLYEELEAIGLSDIYFDDRCFIIARLPGTGDKADAAPIGLMAHIDTAPDTSGEDVRPVVRKAYDGGAIDLGDGHTLDSEVYPTLTRYIGDTIITTDGRTLLGADDKAGIAEIMSAVAYLVEHPGIARRPLELIFTPDEEIGRGMDGFPIHELNSAHCYTLDGSLEGTVEAECFTAYAARIEIEGYVIHPGDARGRMANAVTMAGRFLSMLPGAESPEATDGRYGFYCPVELHGDYGHATVDLILRDFEDQVVQRRIAALETFSRAVEAAHPGGKVTVTTRRQYLNMRDRLSERPEIMRSLEKAIRATGMEPVRHSIRGGTDGARLTEMGIPTPNMFTGGQNFHGRYEWIPLSAMVRAIKTVVNLAQIVE